MNPKVDAYLRAEKNWSEVLKELRALLLAAGLTEEIKWGKPTYTHAGGNVAILQPFNESCALMFFKGALLKDPRGLLERPGEHSHAARRIVFTGADQVAAASTAIKGWISQAIAAEKAGLDVPGERKREPMPAELAAILKRDPALKQAFAALTPGRQRSYILHVSTAKQAATRSTRAEKCAPGILAGKGFNER